MIAMLTDVHTPVGVLAMQVTVIEALPKTALVEFTDADGLLQRRVIPQELHRLSVKGPTTIPDEIVYLGLEYSNVAHGIGVEVRVS